VTPDVSVVLAAHNEEALLRSTVGEIVTELRGIDAAFDRYDARPSKTRKVNSLAYCAQEVLAAAEDMQEAAVGKQREPKEAPGLGGDEVAAYLERCAVALHEARAPQPAKALVGSTTSALRELADSLRGVAKQPPLEEIERRVIHATLEHTAGDKRLAAQLLGIATRTIYRKLDAERGDGGDEEGLPVEP